MKHEIIRPDALDYLRCVGDPVLESITLGDTFERTRDQGFVALATHLGDASTVGKDACDAINQQVAIDEDKVLRAIELFDRYASEICGALLLAALPQAYAAAWGSRVLTETARLQKEFRRRIIGTAQFLMLVMRGKTQKESIRDLWHVDPKRLAEVGGGVELTPPWKACFAVRLYHQSVRVRVGECNPAVGDENAMPLNQEDLLGTLLSFTITVFEVLERYGIAWSADDQEAYLHIWDLVGARLGIGSTAAIEQWHEACRGVDASRQCEKVDAAHPLAKQVAVAQPAGSASVVQQSDAGDFVDSLASPDWVGLRPVSIRDSRRLLDQLRDRQWLPIAASGAPYCKDPGPAGSPGEQWESCRSGRLLVRALLSELTVAMPVGTRPLPTAVVRQLAPGRVRDRLNLGSPGIALSMLDALPERRVLVDRFTGLRAANPLAGAVLRSMANEVTQRTVLRFLRTDDLFIPGLGQWSKAIIDPLEAGIA